MSYLGCKHNSVLLAANMMSHVSRHFTVNMIADYIQCSCSSVLFLCCSKDGDKLFFLYSVTFLHLGRC